MTDAEPRIVEWYRVDPWPRMMRYVVIGPALLTLGALVVAVSFVTRQSADVRLAATAIGFVLVAVAAVVTMAGMFRLLRDDAYLAMRTDGVALRTGGVDVVVPWSDLGAVRWDEARAELVLERDGADELRTAARFAGATGPQLAARIGRVKQRIAMNLLR